MSIFKRASKPELSEQDAAHQRIEQALRDFNLRMAEQKQMAQERHEHLLYRLDKIDEALMSLSQRQMLIVEMLESKKPVTKRKSVAKEGEG